MRNWCSEFFLDTAGIDRTGAPAQGKAYLVSWQKNHLRIKDLLSAIMDCQIYAVGIQA